MAGNKGRQAWTVMQVHEQRQAIVGDGQRQVRSSNAGTWTTMVDFGRKAMAGNGAQCVGSGNDG